MEMNLFNSFDYYNGSNCLYNFIILILIYFFPFNYWYFKSNYLYLVMNMFKFLEKEFNLLINKMLFGGILIYIIFFLYVLQFNIFSMLPYTFILTSMLNMNLFFSLTFFFIFFMMGWMKMWKIMMSHLTPLGSPNILSPILVVIESISTTIRPMTLSIRLTANVISGHILMEILLNPSENMKLILKLILYFLLLPIFLLEMMVCFVQAFVISSLSSLYLGELMIHS